MRVKACEDIYCLRVLYKIHLLSKESGSHSNVDIRDKRKAYKMLLHFTILTMESVYHTKYSNSILLIPYNLFHI